ncbi:hypothetical protein GQ53DRAFT_678171 [Thozetella sp. PMI_491]|nr:hypothetical protein GQ53DRAFT_678171 [Thozetella sp. PMI_491]
MRSWFLAPDFTFRKNGVIRLGTVLEVPWDPTGILASKNNGLPADLQLPPEGKIDEANHEHTTDAGKSGGLKLWADFLELASASVGASADTSHNLTFGKVDHEVWTFDSELGDACLKALVATPKVRKYIDSGFIRRKDVYVITGVRIAKSSFTVSTTSETAISGEASASAPIPASGVIQITAGGEANARVTRSVGHSYETAPDIVFAYRVHVVRTKGDGEVSEKLFRSKKAFLTEASGSELECLEVSSDVLRQCLGGDVEILEHAAGDEDVWISVSSRLSGHGSGRE